MSHSHYVQKNRRTFLKNIISSSSRFTPGIYALYIRFHRRASFLPSSLPFLPPSFLSLLPSIIHSSFIDLSIQPSIHLSVCPSLHSCIYIHPTNQPINQQICIGLSIYTKLAVIFLQKKNLKDF